MNRSIPYVATLLVLLTAFPALVLAGGAGEDCSQPLTLTSLPFSEGNLIFGSHVDDRDASAFSCTTNDGVDRVYEIILGPNQTASCQVSFTAIPAIQQADLGLAPTTAVVSGDCSSSTETFCETGFQPSAITFPGAGTYYIWLDWQDSLVTAAIDCTGALPVELVDFEIE